jgi:hypothetical protein
MNWYFSFSARRSFGEKPINSPAVKSAMSRKFFCGSTMA